MKNIDSDLIRGNIDTIILKTMIDGDKYGLDIIKEVESRSNGTYELKQPTLYSCLKRLENQQLISSYWLDSDIGGKRHYYKLTDLGHETLQKKQEEWAKSKFIIDNLLSNYDFDEYRLVKKDDYDKIIEGKEFVYEEQKNETSQNSPAPSTQDTLSIENDSSDENSSINKSEELSASFPTPDFSDSFDEELNETQNDDAQLEEIEEKITEQAVSNQNRKYFIDFDDEDDNNLQPEIESEKNEDISDENFELEIEEQEQEFSNQSQLEQNDLEDSSYGNDFTQEEPNLNDLENVDFEIDKDEEYSPTYISNQIPEDEEIPEILPEADQSLFENNILSMLRKQENETINTYVGDKQSYINHLNKSNENFEDLNVVQDSMLDIEVIPTSDEIDEEINEFNSAFEELSNFTNLSDDEFDSEIENNEQDESDFTPENTSNYVAEQVTNDYEDEFAEELNSLHQSRNNGFFNSYDNPNYEPVKKTIEPISNYNNLEFDIESDSSDANFDFLQDDKDASSSTNQVFNYNINNNEDDVLEETSYNNQTTNLYDLDQIIATNATSYTKDYVSEESSTFASFTPKFTGDNYKQKLSNLSAYSKVSDDEEKPKEPNYEAIEKAKDIESLKNDFEKEGIKIREFKKYNLEEQSEKTYLLSNKMKLVSSLILLFGFVFVLSSVYIILSNTSFKNGYGFSFNYFLYALIPFGIYTAYHLIKFMFNPYKKIPAKLAPRILIFISIIMTIQLLLITYCVNLQLGFYSFVQEQYNHLLWIIPTVISFAPIVQNIIYISLFYSKNFNV